MNQPQPSDADLIASCLAGDTTAFGPLIERSRTRLTRLLRLMLNNSSDFDDVWQETVLRAYLNLEQLHAPARFGAWICSIAINLARRRRHISFPQTFLRDISSDDASGELTWSDEEQSSPESLVVKQDMVKHVRQAIADLPPAEREAVILVYLNELSHQEAATQLGSSLSAVKVRVHRGRHRLRTALQNEFEPITSHPLKERKMIKVKIYDVMIISPQDELGKPKLTLGNILNMGNRVLILKEETGDRAIDICMNACEIRQIISQLEQQETHRPMTYDLTKTLLDLGRVVVERVIVSRLHENTFYGTRMVKTGSTISEVDCRPSDAITLALRLDVPIFVASEIMDTESFTPDFDGNYTWAKYLELKIRNAGTEQERDDLSKERQWNWQSVLAIDLDQIAQTHLETGEQAWQWIRGLDDEMMRQQTDLEKRQFIASRIKVLLGRSLI
jgi:RNA polymerase sigma factor (sigma-70 family)